MTVLIVFLCLLSLTILAIGIRGRVIQQGVFCRRCRFDLVGINTSNSDALCPECGRSVSSASNRLSCLRRRWWLPLILGSVMLLGVVGVSGIYASNNQALIFSNLPDPAVIMSAKWGNSAALDELVARLAGTQVISDSQWDEIVIHALEFQADPTQAWDLRWGEVLLLGVQGGKLSDEQIGAYIHNGHTYKVDMRLKLNEGTRDTPVRLTVSTGRISSLSGGQLDYNISSSFAELGVVGNQAEPSRSSTGPRSTSINIRIPRGMGTGSSSITTNLDLRSNGQLPRAGEEIDVFVDHEVTIVSTSDDRTLASFLTRADRTISIVERDEELIARVAPIGGEAMIPSTVFIDKDITVADPLPADDSFQTIIDFYITFIDLPQPVSYQSYIRTSSGEEIPLRSFATRGSSGHNTHGMQWTFSSADPSLNERVRGAIAEMVENKETTIVLRVDIEGAIKNPDLIEVLDLDLIFEHVPVRTAAAGEFNSFSSGQDGVAAKVLTED